MSKHYRSTSIVSFLFLSLGLCRRRCQTVPSCHAVSIVPLEETGAVECRTSEEPDQLGEWRDRPLLLKTPGAIHFLETGTPEPRWGSDQEVLHPTHQRLALYVIIPSVADEENWTQPEADGLFYFFSDEKFCPTSYQRATAKTSLKYSILKKKLDEFKG